MIIKLRNGVTSKYIDSDVEYTVFAIYFGVPTELMIQVDSFPSEPFGISVNDIDIVDNRLSKYWHFGNALPSTNKSNGRPVILAFPEWIDDIGFYQEIVEGTNSAGYIWREYKARMSLEFAPSSIKSTAIFLGDDWMQCENCSDAWIPDVEGELICCPSCLKLQKRS